MAPSKDSADTSFKILLIWQWALDQSMLEGECDLGVGLNVLVCTVWVWL